MRDDEALAARYRKGERWACAAIVFSIAALVALEVFAEDAETKAYHHALTMQPDGVIFPAAVEGLRPDRITGITLVMLDVSPSQIAGLMDCPSPDSVGVPARWAEVGPAEDPSVAAIHDVLRSAIEHERAVWIEVLPARDGLGVSGWCRVAGATLRTRDADKIPKDAKDR